MSNVWRSGAKFSAFCTFGEEVLLFYYDNSLLKHTFRNQWPHMTFHNFGPKKILSLRPWWPHNGNFRVKIFLLHFWNQNVSILKKKQKKNSIFLTLGDDHIWRHQNGMCPDLRVKDIFDVGETYMVRKVFIRAIFWTHFK